MKMLAVMIIAFFSSVVYGAEISLSPLQTYQHWVLNKKGQVVIFRGVNLVIKSGESPQQAGFDLNDVKLLQKYGFNVVRLGVLWHSIEPQPHQYNHRYLSEIQNTVKLLASHGIYTLIDFHEDQYSQLYGDGAPGWATTQEGTHEPDVGFPCNLFGGDKIRTDIDHAYTAFWQNAHLPGLLQEGLQDAYIRMVKYVVNALKDEESNLIGFDLMNEPFVGIQWPSCINIPRDKMNLQNLNFLEKNLGCREFDKNLTQFYQKLVTAIRDDNQDTILWYETNLLYGLGAKNYLGKVQGKNIGLSFHDYTGKNVNAPIQQALSYQKQNKVPLLEGEYGATTDLALLKKFAEANNKSMISSIYWAYANDASYRFCTIGKYLPTDPRKQGIVIDLKKPLEAPNLNVDMLNVLSGVYPQEISGTPLSFSYDQNKKIFLLKYNPVNPLGKVVASATKIYIPLMQFPNGYKVRVKNGVVVSKKNSEYLLVENSNNSTVTIRVER
jgi:endoglycosylceramidase